MSFELGDRVASFGKPASGDRRFGVHYMTVSRAVNKYEENIAAEYCWNVKIGSLSLDDNRGGESMRRDTAVKLLKEQKEVLQSRLGVTRLGLFGSVARDEATVDSDVDVVMEHPNLFDAAEVFDIYE